MKKTLASLALASALAFSASGVASTLYPDGIFNPTGITVSDLLADGWSTVYDTPYGLGIDHNSLQSAVGGTYVFVGAADLQGNIILGATGLTSEVLSQTFSTSVASSYSSSNLYWYNYWGLSFGFTATQNIYLTSADATGIFTADDGMNAYRLSWHDDGGGWRVGSIDFLNDEPTGYRKIVLTSNSGSSVPDAGTTGALLAISLLGLVGVRRFKRA